MLLGSSFGVSFLEHPNIKKDKIKIVVFVIPFFKVS